METLPAIAVALALIVIVPGPNVFVVMTTAVADRNHGIRAALGVSTGDMIWATGALIGLGALLANARPVFEVIRWAGVAYLLWYAVRLWRTPPTATSDVVAPSRRPFLNGLLIDLANPKAAVFFTTLFASLLPSSFGVAFGIAVLGVVAVIVYGWYLLLALVLSQPALQRSYRRATRTIDRVAAVVVGGFGIRLAVQR